MPDSPSDPLPAPPTAEPAADEGRAPLIEPAALLAPPRARGRPSVVRITDHWYPVALSTELRRRPIARTLLGIPLALFRDGSGRAAAVLDRCPHRNVPLSIGEVEQGQLQCGYHGWRFDTGGACRFIPSLQGEPDTPARRVPAFPTMEQHGFVWVYPTAGARPEREPYRFPEVDTRGYTTVREVVEAECTMHAALENALDVPHTAYLHRGLFRSKSRGIEITAHVRRTHDRVEAEYIGEPRPPGLVARLLSPSGGIVTHFDRFILPCIAQVEYRLGRENHIVITSAMTPVSDFHTRIFAVVSFRLRLPGWLVKPFLRPLALRIFQQDAVMLKHQTENIRRFGGEQYVWTDIDVLGRHIWRLLRTTERGDSLAGHDHEERVTLVV
jgi:phenylpropionate dioxygenase-like ring-hydroxylating dioxygenase large terminal subunit